MRQSEDQTLMGLTFDGNRYSYREPDRGPYAYYGNDRRWDNNGRWDNNRRRSDRDHDGIRDNRDNDRDGDGVRNSRDSHPNNKNRH
ncbi:hypothetical protein HK414_05485 [Ramlibacter terrae]|uniref:Uncharacterized protein n=1 Tax=Ramlibacter terrae TaxID=2732511 RepID=A0ABX6P0U9_9BURK|nr:hypothetical protein HK414_05485 [Ramlibacter terrae]